MYANGMIAVFGKKENAGKRHELFRGKNCNSISDDGRLHRLLHKPRCNSASHIIVETVFRCCTNIRLLTEGL